MTKDEVELLRQRYRLFKVKRELNEIAEYLRKLGAKL